MDRKSQAAMEFLMTYGWAILVVLVVIGALTYFGVLTPSTLLPEKCTVALPFSCSDFIVGENGVGIGLQNGAGKDVSINKISFSSEAISGSCMVDNLDATLRNGESMAIYAEGCFFASADGKKRYDVEITYTLLGSSLEHTVLGELLARRESGVDVSEISLGGSSFGGSSSGGGSEGSPGSTCKTIKDAYPLSSDGTYWIDPDGEGGSDAFQVYCDMTTDGGGWTLVFMCFPYGTSCYNTGTIGSSYPVLSDTNTKKFSDAIIKQLLNGGEKIARTQWWHVSKNSGSVWADGNLADTSFPTGSLWNLFEFPNSWSSTSSSNGQRFQRKMGTGGSWTGWITSGSTTGCAQPAGGWSNYYEQSCQQSWFASCEGEPAINHNCANPPDRADKLIVWVR